MVTGASRGIGRAIALGLAACGGAGRDLRAQSGRPGGGGPRGRRRAAAVRPVAVGVTADVTIPAGVAALVAAALSACGGIDVVVNNVGGSGARDFASTDDADRQAVLDRNPPQGELMEFTRASGFDSTRVENLIRDATCLLVHYIGLVVSGAREI